MSKKNDLVLVAIVTIINLRYARSISPHVTAVHVVMDVDKADTLREEWHQWQKHIGVDSDGFSLESRFALPPRYCSGQSATALAR